ncbi:MAG: hypothetical protein ACI8RD_007608, partial [Bacillariaceae sp.]
VYISVPKYPLFWGAPNIELFVFLFIAGLYFFLLRNNARFSLDYPTEHRRSIKNIFVGGGL